MKVFTVRRFAGSCGVATFLAAVVAATGTPASSDVGRHVLRGVRPSWTIAVPQTAVVPDDKLVHAKVWLAPRNADDLTALAKSVSDPDSSQYGQFISPQDYNAQFAPTTDQVGQVRQWLTGDGLTVDAVGPSNHFLAVSGSADEINTAFGTRLSLFLVKGNQEQAPATDVSVPDAVAEIVQTVTGLTTFGHKVTPNDLGAPAAFVNSTQCSDYYGQQNATSLPKFNGKTLPFAVCGYTPSQLRSVYGVDRGHSHLLTTTDHLLGGGNHGNGTTVAITDAFDASTLEGDANRYASRHGDSPFSHRQFSDRSVPENTSLADDCGGNGWYGEQTLDIEAVHGMAGGANVAYYGAASCYDDDLLAALAQVVDDNDASVVTNSWGEPTFVVIDGQLYTTIDQDLVDAYESVFKQGAVQGIGFYFSSGDNGDEEAAYGYKHPDWPTGDPWVTSVGGTALAVTRDGSRAFETGWGTSKYGLSSDGSSWEQTVPFLYGAGGGFSEVFSEPWYQQGVVPSGTTGRAVPDIGMDADPTTGMLVGETQDFPAASRFGPAGVHYGEYRIGGTSLASPLLAGVQAVAQGNGHRLGFANPMIYSLARGHGNPYFDVTPHGDAGNVRADYVNSINGDDGTTYSVRTFDQDSSLTTGGGWDDVTGVGSVTADYIAAAGSRRH